MTVSNSPASRMRRNKRMKAARKTTARTTRRRKALPSLYCRAKLAVERAELNRRETAPFGAARPSARRRSIPVMIRLVWSLDRHADIGRLLVGHFRELGADLGEMQARHLLIETLRQGVDFLLVFARIVPELDLRQRLV